MKRNASRGAKKFFRKFTMGFTLVELIVVITILAILATVGFLSLSGYSDDARNSAAKANVRMVYSAIATESATSGNSPRYYVEHSSAAALSGSVTVGNVTVTLTGGDWNVPNTNYSAGNPRWDLLRLNPDKFRLSSAFPRTSGLGMAEPALAAYDSGSLTVGAVDVPGQTTISGRKRTSPVFQVTAVSKTKAVATMGNYSPASWTDLQGLVKDPASGSSTGALVDSSQPSADGTGGGAGGTTAYVPGTAYIAGQTFTWTSPAGSTMTITVTGNGIGTVEGQFAQTGVGGTACNSPDIAIWYGSDVQVWSACNMGTATSGTGSASYGLHYQWGNNRGFTSGSPVSYTTIDCSAFSASTYSGTFIAKSTFCSVGNQDLWGEITNTPAARRWPCPAGYHVPSSHKPSRTTGEFPTLKTIMAGYEATGIGSCKSTGSSSATIQTKNAICALKVPSAGYINPGVLPGPSSVGTLALLSSGTQFNVDWDRTQIYYDASSDSGWIGTNQLSWLWTAYPVRCIKD